MENIKEKLTNICKAVQELNDDVHLYEDYIYDIRIVTLLDDDNPVYQVRLRNSFDGPDLLNVRFLNVVAELPFCDETIEMIAGNIEYMATIYDNLTFEWFSS